METMIAQIDVCVGEECGFDVARALTDARPGLAVLLVSTDDGYGCRERVRECGACGFVLKSHLAKANLSTLWRHADSAQRHGPG